MKGRDGMITPYVRCLSCLPVTLRCLHGRTCLVLVDRLTMTYFAPTWASALPPKHQGFGPPFCLATVRLSSHAL